MIDLKRKGLPDCIEGNLGGPVSINTDYRIWIDFPDRIEKAINGDMSGYNELFNDDAPYLTEHILEQLQDFYYKKSEVPRDAGGNSVELLDYDIDADYIYAAFKQSYGIDLADENLHWHKFIALLMALPEDTTLSRIMSYRAYEGSSKDPGYEGYMKLKHMWALPTKFTQEEQEALDEFNEIFG